MSVFSAFIPEIHHNASPGFVDVLIRTQREELFTGLMQLHYPANENLVLAFIDGAEQQLYRYHENTTEIIPRQTWHQSMNHPNATVGLLELSLEAMRVLRVAHETPVVRVERLRLTTSQLVEQADQWSREAEPGIVHVRGGQVEYVYLFVNRVGSIFESVAFADGKAQYAVSDSFSAPNDTEVQVTRYVSSPDHAVWREYELRLAFQPFVKMLISRFNELAGRALADRLCEQLTAWARGGGWNIILVNDDVIHRHYFETVDAAVSAYVDILRRFQFEASPAIGSRLAEGITRDALLKLDLPRRELFLQHIFSQPSPGTANK